MIRDHQGRTVGFTAEYLFAVVILICLWKVASFLNGAGYLPPPFFDQSGDTFMDWYNTAYWGRRPGTYSEWHSIYPPLSFIFLKLFGISKCYEDSALVARECDPIGMWLISAATLLNTALVLLEFRRTDARTSVPRALALGLGMPALFAWERGNLIVLCFTFFILAHGRILRAGWLRWTCMAVTLNFKPYLIITTFGRLVRRQWRWAEGCGVAFIIIYIISYMLLGKGDPIEVINNTIGFSGAPQNISLDYIEYATTYQAILTVLSSQIPLMHFIGSVGMEWSERVLPLLIKGGAVGVLICFAGAVWRPFALSVHRTGALGISLLLTVSVSVGGYAEVFLLFFLFKEKWHGLSMTAALLAGYLLCIPWDYMLFRVFHQITFSFLSDRVVGYDFGVTLGAIVRPGLLLIVEYGLIAASLIDLFRARRTSSRPLPIEDLGSEPVTV